MNKLLKIVIGIVVLFACAIGLVFFLTAGMQKTADQFFGAVKAQDYATAQSLLSEDFRAATSAAELRKFLESSALPRFKEASWSNRSISGGRGELVGSVTTEEGGVIPIRLGLVKESGRWLIHSLFKERAGLTADDAGKVPGERELVALVNESMGVIAQAIVSEEFSGLHRHIAILWQRQVSVQDLAQIMKSFTDTHADLRPVLGRSPVFEGAPSLNDDGVLVIKGYYPTDPSRVVFQLKYLFEGMSWRLCGMQVNAVAAR